MSKGWLESMLISNGPQILKGLSTDPIWQTLLDLSNQAQFERIKIYNTRKVNKFEDC